MKKLENLTKENLCHIAREIADVYMAEPGLFPMVFSKEKCRLYFDALVQIIYENDSLYTINDEQDGYCAYWAKADKPPIHKYFKLAYLLIKKLSLKDLVALIKTLKGHRGYEKIYKNQEYVDFFMVVVKKEKQGQGLLRVALNEAFAYADALGVPCVLDTDSKLKANKYIHCGMRLIYHQQLASHAEMFTLAYSGVEQYTDIK